MLIEFFTGNREERTILRTRDRLVSRKTLSSRARQELEEIEKEAQEISRRLFLKKVGVVIASLATTVVIGKVAWPLLDAGQRTSLPDWITIEGAREIDSDRLQQAVEAAKDWNSRFNCGRNIIIRPLKWPQRQDLGGGYMATTLEEADAGYIELGSEGNARNIILHAMTHACKPDQPTLLPTPLQFSDGLIRGYHGFTILVTSNDGREIKYTKIEEGMAERNASVFPGYTITDDRYFAVGNLARQHFPFERFSTIHEGLRRNNVPSLIRARLNLSGTVPLTAAHHNILMDEYQLAWDRGLR